MILTVSDGIRSMLHDNRPYQKPKSYRSLINKTPVTSDVIVSYVQPKVMSLPSVDLEEAYHQLYHQQYVALKMGQYVVFGSNLRELAYRMLKYQCRGDYQFVLDVQKVAPSGFFEIVGGGHVYTRVAGRIGLRSDLSRQEAWAVIKATAKNAEVNEKDVRLYFES